MCNLRVELEFMYIENQTPYCTVALCLQVTATCLHPFPLMLWRWKTYDEALLGFPFEILPAADWGLQGAAFCVRARSIVAYATCVFQIDVHCLLRNRAMLISPTVLPMGSVV
jgi:hypothetical protein